MEREGPVCYLMSTSVEREGKGSPIINRDLAHKFGAGAVGTSLRQLGNGFSSCLAGAESHRSPGTTAS